MQQQFEVFKNGDRTTLVAVFCGQTGLYLSAHLYLPRSEQWLYLEDFPCASLDAAREFFDAIAQSWNEDPEAVRVFSLNVSSDTPKSGPRITTPRDHEEGFDSKAIAC